MPNGNGLSHDGAFLALSHAPALLFCLSLRVSRLYSGEGARHLGINLHVKVQMVVHICMCLNKGLSPFGLLRTGQKMKDGV